MILFGAVALALVEMASGQAPVNFQPTPILIVNTLNLITEMKITASIKKEHKLRCDEEARKKSITEVPPAQIKKAPTSK